MAAAEARALLDQLMGGDRNAPLPKGAALPTNKKKRKASDGSLLLPGKRHKSCYDRDICPLYCAWGIDVYDLFVNTKSDLGPNPNKADDDARKEYLTLPQHEKERLGFEHLLFHKLGELVQQCDRAVTRNQEKLNKELQRQLQKRGGQDYVIDVDDSAVEQLCRNQLLVEELTSRVNDSLSNLKTIKSKEDDLSLQIVNQKKLEDEKQQKEKSENEVKEESNTDDKKDETAVKQEGEGGNAVKEEDNVKTEETGEAADGDKKGAVKEEETDGDAAVKQEEPKKEEETENKENGDAPPPPPQTPSLPKPPSPAALELGKMILEKQKVLCEIANILSQLGPSQEAVESQSRQLNHVKSDITTDKTVCEVSGNFMSARDADERIAAHYAGKQYVGWKLVREKFKELLDKHGKYGPPPPGRGPPGPGGPPLMAPPGRGGRPGGGGGNDRRGSGGRDFYGGGGGGDYRGRRGGGGPPGGPPRGRRSPSPPGRWERGGGGGGYGGDRGGGGYGNRGGGGYDRDRRGGGGGYGRSGGGGGGWGRR